MPITVALCLLLTSFQAGVVAQDKPNFLGEWILVSPSEPPAGTARTFTVAHEAASIRITRMTDSGLESASYTIDLATTSGAVTGTSGTVGTLTKNQALWAGRSLEFNDNNCRSQRDGIETCVQRSEVWSLGKTGLLSIERTTFGPGKRVSKATFIYRKPGQ